MLEVILFFISFSLVYLIYYLFVIRREKKLKKLLTSTECLYLKVKYNVHLEKIDLKTLANHIAIVNSFIMATTVFIISVIDNWLLKFVCGFFVLMLLILISYHLLGTYYKKKEKR